MDGHYEKFNTEAEYNTWRNSDKYTTPNVSVILEPYSVRYNNHRATAGDIAYWDGTSVKILPKGEYKESFGTAVGLVVIPEGMLPDGRARIVATCTVDKNGNQTNSQNQVSWCTNTNKTDITELTNYDRLIGTDNTKKDNISLYNSNGVFLPSDYFKGEQSFVDKKAKYYTTMTGTSLYMAPSPYLYNDDGSVTMNPSYYIYPNDNSLNIITSDFNGLGNTEILVGLGSEYEAANACWKYKDGTGANLQWYLPSAGELGFLIVRLKELNLAHYNLFSLPYNCTLLSSTECSDSSIAVFFTEDGVVNGINSKSARRSAIPFAII